MQPQKQSTKNGDGDEKKVQSRYRRFCFSLLSRTCERSAMALKKLPIESAQL
jgi:hypothetical protein